MLKEGLGRTDPSHELIDAPGFETDGELQGNKRKKRKRQLIEERK